MHQRARLGFVLLSLGVGLLSCREPRRNQPTEGSDAPRPSGPMQPADPRNGTGEAMAAAQGKLEVTFLGFDQTGDGKQRLVRFQLTNRTKRPIRAVRLRLHYRDHGGKAVGELPLQVVRPRGQLGPGVTLQDTFELLGQRGPVEAVTGVRITVEEIRFEDGMRWAPRRPPGG